MFSAESRREGGFSLLEVLLASMVLLAGVMAVTKLTQGTLGGLTGTTTTERASGPIQNPLLVDQLLRERVERMRSGDAGSAAGLERVLEVPYATYRTFAANEGALKPAANGLSYTRFRVWVTMQLREPAGQPQILVGQVRFDMITGAAGAGL